MPSASELISQLYAGYFNRAPDPAGLNYWVGHLNAGLSLTQIAQSFAVQPEATSLYGFLSDPASASRQAFLSSVYSNLFNRAPDAAGQAYWLAQLSNPAISVGRILSDILSGAQGNDALIVTNKGNVGVFFASQFAANNTPFTLEAAHSVLADVTENPASVATAVTTVNTTVNPPPPPPPPPPVAFTLVGTTGADTLTGGVLADSITGAEGADTVTGGPGNDSITMLVTNGDTDTIDAGTDTDTLVLSGVAPGAITVNLSVVDGDQYTGGTDGLTQKNFENVNAKAVTGAKVDVTTIAATTSVGLGTVTAATISGAATAIAIDASTLVDNGTATLSGSNMVPTVTGLTGTLIATSVTGALTVTTADAADQAIAITTGAAATTVTAATAGDTVTVTATALVDNILLSLSGNSNFTVTFLQGNLTVDNASAGNVAVTLAAVAGSTVAFGTNTTGTHSVNADALTDGQVLTLTGTDAASVSLVAGDLTAGAYAGDLTVTATTGTNVITTGGGADSITGGAGADTLTGGNGDDIFLFNTGDVAATETIAGGAGTDTIRVVTSTDFTNLATTTIRTAGEVEQILITSGTTATFTGAQLTGQTIAVNASAAGAATLAVNVTGTTAVTLANLTFTLFGSNNAFDTGTDVITITGDTAANTITGTSIADTITGAAGADTITGGGGADSITGAADNDSIVLTETTAAIDKVVFSGGATNAATLAANGLDTITGFGATDTINIAALGNGSLAALTGTLSAPAAQSVIADASVFIIDTAATAGALTTGGSATVTDFTNMTQVAAFLSERFSHTLTTADIEAVFVWNVGTTTYVYNVDTLATANTTIDAAEVSLVGSITQGAALATGNIVFA